MLSFPEVGDDSSAWAINASAEGITLNIDLILGRVGNEMFEFVYEDLDTADISQLQSLVSKGVARIKDTP